MVFDVITELLSINLNSFCVSMNTTDVKEFQFYETLQWKSKKLFGITLIVRRILNYQYLKLYQLTEVKYILNLSTLIL